MPTMPRSKDKKTPRQNSSPVSGPVAVLVLSWLIPGYGFYRNGLKRHALLFFLLLEGTFLAGAALHGSVLLPEFSPRSEGFNLVTILTFFVQMCNGLLGLVSLLPDLAGAKMAVLPYNERHPLAELGAFYLLVSGGMNYFVITSTWDHFYGPRSREAANQAPAAARPAAPIEPEKREA